ncbi:hypothetical protein GVX82_02075 [Patescibacteria group bacterium]|jgi:uncharacterized protein YhbP (UPF0306 family)|nr:hypothetical protein [Patescibacteria group bacterium]
MARTPTPAAQRRALARFIEENRLLTLATVGDRGTPWAATMFFAFDRDLALYVVASPETQHARDIAASKRVAGTISHAWQHPETKAIRGVQFVGRAKRLAKKDVPAAHRLFKKRMPWVDHYLGDHAFYRIDVSEYWLIDQDLFGDHFRRKVAHRKSSR